MGNAITPFEKDIYEQPDALRRLAERFDPKDLKSFASKSWDRIIITGMGSSYCAGVPTWRTLTRNNVPVWAIDTSQLLDTPELLQGKSLVIATSQSGESGEIVRLIDMKRTGNISIGGLIGIADSETSTLARESDVFLPLFSGPEATVSTKSYLNSLAVHQWVTSSFADLGNVNIVEDIYAAADVVTSLLKEVSVEDFCIQSLKPEKPRVVMIGRFDDAATSIYSGLITKEAAKIPAEGFVGGQFRHGPFELAGPNLSAIFYESGNGEKTNVYQKLIDDLISTGSQVLIVGGAKIHGAGHIAIEGSSPLVHLSGGGLVAQLLALNLGRANDVTPGDFIYGSKVTTLI